MIRSVATRIVIAAGTFDGELKARALSQHETRRSGQGSDLAEGTAKAFFTGRLDEVRRRRRALSPHEVRTLVQPQLPTPNSSLETPDSPH